MPLLHPVNTFSYSRSLSTQFLAWEGEATPLNMFSSTLPNPFLAWEGEATPLNMFSPTLPNPFLAWEGEAPAEPLRRKLGRSLALPLISNPLDIAQL